MSKAKLKKALAELSKDGVIEMVTELYDARPEARDYLEYWLDPNPDREFQAALEKVDKMFFYSTGKNRTQPSQTSLKRLVKDFSTLVFDSEKIAQLYLHIAESHAKWLRQKQKGRGQSEKAVRRNLQLAEEYIVSAQLESVFEIRLERLRKFIDDVMDLPEFKDRRGWRRFFI